MNAGTLTLILSAIGVIGIPTLVAVARAIVKQTRIEDSLAQVVKDLHSLVEHKDQDHALMRNRLSDLEHSELTRLRQLAREM